MELWHKKKQNNNNNNNKKPCAAEYRYNDPSPNHTAHVKNKMLWIEAFDLRSVQYRDVHPLKVPVETELLKVVGHRL